jgi:hypothetical protein
MTDPENLIDRSREHGTTVGEAGAEADRLE